MAKPVFNDDADRLLSIKEVSQRIGTSEKIVGDMINAGMLSALSFRKIRRVRKIILNKFLNDFDGCDIYEELVTRSNDKKIARQAAG